VAHTTLSVLHSQDFPQVFDGAMDRFIGLVEAVYDKYFPPAQPAEVK
jgi:hypothetical protein